MENGEHDSSYPPKAYAMNNQQGYGSPLRSNPKHPAQNSMHSRASNQYVGREEEDVEDEELGEGEGGSNGVKLIEKDNYNEEEDEEEEEEDDYDSDDDDDENGEDDKDHDGARPRKKWELKNLISNYEFAPRVPAPAPAPAVSAHQDTPSRASSRRHTSGVEWTELETFALLDAWGKRFLKLGSKSLRSEEWQEVADKVSQETNIERTYTQCRNRLDTLKKKYRREKMKLEAAGGGVASKWPFYRKMDMVLNPPPLQRQASLLCGVDSGEYVFIDPKVYLNRANGLDEIRDSPGNSESWRDDGEDDSDGHPPTAKRNRGTRVDSTSFRLLADSIQKFSEIYEKIEVNKRKQMVELENMRMDFHRQLETQRRQILERAQAEIVKIRQGDGDDDDEDDDNDLSADD